MSFTEIDLFGVYVAPISLLMVAAWFVTNRIAQVRQPLLSYVASGAIRVCCLRDHSFIHDPAHRAGRALTVAEITPKRGEAHGPEAIRPPEPRSSGPARRVRSIPMALTKGLPCREPVTGRRDNPLATWVGKQSPPDYVRRRAKPGRCQALVWSLVKAEKFQRFRS
jgi:hypothetical protein